MQSKEHWYECVLNHVHKSIVNILTLLLNLWAFLCPYEDQEFYLNFLKITFN